MARVAHGRPTPPAGPVRYCPGARRLGVPRDTGAIRRRRRCRGHPRAPARARRRRWAAAVPPTPRSAPSPRAYVYRVWEGGYTGRRKVAAGLALHPSNLGMSGFNHQATAAAAARRPVPRLARAAPAVGGSRSPAVDDSRGPPRVALGGGPAVYGDRPVHG